MSIENGVATGAPKAASQGAAAHGHRKTQGAGAAASDFASVLTDLGAGDVPLESGPADVRDDAVSAPPLAADAPQDQRIDASQPPAQAQVEPTSAPDARDRPADGAVLAVGDAGPKPRVARPAIDSADVSAREAARDVPPAPAEKMAGQGAGVQADDDVQPLLRQATLVQRLSQQRTEATEAANRSAKESRGEDLAARLGWRLSENPASAGGQPQILLAAGSGEAGLRLFERRADKNGHRNGGVGEVGAWSGQPQMDGGRVDVPAVAPDGGLTTEMRVAEQVSYWVGRGAQNAELELEGLGEGPVKVSIALQGQEARVEFRADQAQTRQVLQDSMPHLRELLEREGLVLSGMSVGSSGAEGGNGQSSQGRQGGRQGQGGTPEVPAVALGGQRGTPLSGRSVDLFV